MGSNHLQRQQSSPRAHRVDLTARWPPRAVSVFGAIATPKINNARLIADLRTSPRLPNYSLSALPEIPPHRWLSLDSFFLHSLRSSSEVAFYLILLLLPGLLAVAFRSGPGVFFSFLFFFICRSLACDFCSDTPAKYPIVYSLFIFAPISPIISGFYCFRFIVPIARPALSVIIQAMRGRHAPPSHHLQPS